MSDNFYSVTSNFGGWFWTPLPTLKTDVIYGSLSLVLPLWSKGLFFQFRRQKHMFYWRHLRSNSKLKEKALDQKSETLKQSCLLKVFSIPSMIFHLCSLEVEYYNNNNIIFCYSPKHCFRLIEGQQYHFWSEKSPAVGLEPPTLGIQGRRLHHSSTEHKRQDTT